MRQFHLAALTLLIHTTAFSEPGYHAENLVLYQPNEVLKQHIPSVESLGAYFKKIETEFQAFFAGENQPSNLTAVIAVKPAGQSRVWFISSAEKSTVPGLAGLKKKVEAVPAPDVYGGPFAFAIRGKIAGGVPSAPENGPPIPQEWQDALKDKKESIVLPDDIVAAIWPDAPGSNKPPETPSEFVSQLLEPLGGEIEKPKDWFYREAHRKSTFMWTLSREDSQATPYTTGVRIQAFVGLRKAAGKSAREFILDFIKAKKAGPHVEVVDTCEEKDQGMFSRICLEIIEGPNHILYSMFWGNEMDMAVISIAGTTKELWSVYAPAFDKMSRFKLLDAKRFEQKKP